MARRRRRKRLGAFAGLAEPERFGLTVWDGLTVATAALGALIAARRPFAEPWQAGLGALIGGSISVIGAQGYSAYKRHAG
jgi:hypothetical protein